MKVAEVPLNVQINEFGGGIMADGKGNAGKPSTTGNPSGGGRDNADPKK